MSICVEYSEDPRSTSGGRYHSVTTSLEYVLVGTDLARAKPGQKTGRHLCQSARPCSHTTVVGWGFRG